MDQASAGGRKPALSLVGKVRPDRELVIAVSRRFNHAASNFMYANRVAPVLNERGLVLTCDFASDAADHLDYWMNRMNVVLDLADVHVLIDIDRSPNTFYELIASNLSCRWGSGVSLTWNFGLERPISERPLQIIVHNGIDARAQARLFEFGTRISLCVPIRADTGPGVLEDDLAEVLDGWTENVRTFRARHLRKPGVREYWDTKRHIATMIAGGATPADAADAILREAAAAGGPEETARIASMREAIAASQESILANNRELRELAGLNANVFANPDKKLLAETASRLQEVQIIYAGLRDDPNYDKVSRDIRKLIRMPVVCTFWKAWALITISNIRKDRASMGVARSTDGRYRFPEAQSVWTRPQTRARGRGRYRRHLQQQRAFPWVGGVAALVLVSWAAWTVVPAKLSGFFNGGQMTVRAIEGVLLIVLAVAARPVYGLINTTYRRK